MIRWWQDLSVVKKLYGVVGLMAILIAVELFTLLFAMNTLSSVRAFVAGEGLWTKSQKDALLSLYQFARRGQEKYYVEFKDHLTIPAGDHHARIELTKEKFDYETIRNGFLQGGNHPHDIDGMIKLLVRFHSVSYISDAITAWTNADQLLEELKQVGEDLRETIRRDGVRSPQVDVYLDQVANINSRLTVEENSFSASLGAGSRKLEEILMSLLALTVFAVEGTGIFLTYRFSRSLSRSLNELRDTAYEVGTGNLTRSAEVHSKDELGQLATALNKMIEDLKIGFKERQRSEERLKTSEGHLLRLNEELEDRVDRRTEEVQQRAAQLRFIANSLPVLIAQLDEQEKFLFANDAFCRWFGQTQEEVIGKTFRFILGEGRYSDNSPYIIRVLKGETVTYEKRSEIGNAAIDYSITFVPEFDESLQVKGFILVGSDVTKHKEIESELKKAKEVADSANATKSTFLANMSHEIRTPLGIILGFAELMTSSDLSSGDRAHSLEVIKRNGELLSNVIEDILDISKVEAGKLEIELIAVSYSNIMKEIESLLRLKASEKGIQFVIISDPIIPNTIQTDPLRLRQILINIIGNAIKFTHSGSVIVKVSLNSSMKLSFMVTDSGKGITAAQAQKLFTPFTQADASTTRKYGGTGLGLVLAKNLANALGGDVVLVQSTPEFGSTFEVTIDSGRENSTLASEFDSLNAAPTASNSLQKYNNLRILVVDDSPDNQIIVSRLLSKVGADVETANNGEEGVAKALAGNFALVLMDLQMPVLDGHGAVKELRRQGYLGPIVALTAHAMKEERRRCLEGGFNDHLSKPVNYDLLLQTVTRFTVGSS